MIKITMVCVSFCFCLSAHPEYGGGTGEPNSPYEVNDLAHLQYISGNYWNWDKCFVLKADIDTPPDSNVGLIGDYFVRFTGTFDGRGHVIRGLHIDSNSTGWFGLFGYTEPSAQISNLSLTHASIAVDYEESYGGLLVGFNEGVIRNCSSSGFVRGGWVFRGLVGINNGGTITNCYSECVVNGCGSSVPNMHFAGGLVGDNWGTISNCYSSGAVCAFDTEVSYAVGGLVARNLETIKTVIRQV